MKNISIFFAALVAVLFSVAETSAQITPPYYNPANVRVTGGTINGTTMGATVPTTGAFTNLTATTLFTVGSGSTTNAGLIAGYSGISGYGSLWSTGVTPSTSNYAIATRGTDTFLNGTASSGHAVNGNVIFSVSSTEAIVASGNKLRVGTGSGTSAGLIAGYSGVSSYGSIWSTGITPSSSNYSYSTNGSTTAINASVNTHISVADSPIATATSTTFTSNVPLRLKGYTVATLPAAGTAGRIAYVTDASAPTYNGALTGGGAVVIPVFDNGSAWVAH